VIDLVLDFYLLSSFQALHSSRKSEGHLEYTLAAYLVKL